IFQVLNIVGMDVSLLHPVMIEGAETVEIGDACLEKPVLQPLEIFPGHLLDAGIPWSHHISPLRSITRFAFPSNLGSEPGSTSFTVVRSSSVSRSSFTTFF